MSNYTDQEVQDAVEKIVRSSVRHPTGILGERKIDVSFSDIQEAAAGCFILYFNAPFYVLKLGVKRLQDALDSQAQTIASLIDAVEATDRLTTPITDISLLANARSALEELEAAVSSRDQGFSDISKVPAYRRYVQNLDGFLGATGSNIRKTGADGSAAIVDTPSGARGKIPGLVRQLVDQQNELIRRVKLLAGAIDDFASLNLPRIAAQGVISRARDVLDSHYNDLAALDENSRLDNLRAVTLDLLTQRPLVTKYGAATAPSEFITTSGLATAYADTQHLAVPAVRESSSSGPYPILAANQLIRFTLDGGTPFDFPLPLSYVAELLGTLQEPFAITADSNAMRIVFGQLDTGGATFDIPLTIGTRSAQQIVTEVNAGLGASSLRMQKRFVPLRYSGPVTTTSLGGNNARFTILAGDLNALGVVVGDDLDVVAGTNAGTTWGITAVDPLGQYVDTAGVAPVVPASDDSIETGPAARALQLVDTDELGSVVQRRAIRLPRTDGVQDLTHAILGFFPGIEVRSRPVSAQAVVDNITGSTAALSAKVVFHPFEYVGSARSEPTDPTRVVLSKLVCDGLLGTGGTNIALAVAVPDSVQLGDRVVIRSSLTPTDIGVEGSINTIASGVLGVTFPVPVTDGAISIEVGPDVTFGFGDVLIISDGPNQGHYYIGEDQLVKTTASFELVIESSLPVFKDGNKSIGFNVEFGSEDVSFVSRDTTLVSAITVDNAGTSHGADYFLDPIDVGVPIKGFTKFIRFDTFPAGVTVGDLVQFYVGSYNVVDVEQEVVSIDSTLQVLELSAAVASTFSLTFDFGVPNPFGRIRIAQVANYTELKDGSTTWLGQSPQQELFFRNLARALNPIVTNANPTPSMINDATNLLEDMAASLTELGAVFDLYEAPAVEPVDVMLSTFRQKGADRAIDLLLEGQFSTFFNLNVDGVSYSGTLMSGMRDLAREDLPIRKFNRRDTAGQKLIGAQPDDKDFEFSSDDADSPMQPDIPMAPDVASPGENL
jgi:hypothetical protein